MKEIRTEMGWYNTKKCNLLNHALKIRAEQS
jgi:hypothetical protein